jgi:transposase-like protein
MARHRSFSSEFKRQLAKEFLDGRARGCRIMKLARSTYYYRSRRRAAEKKVLRDRVEAPCAEFPRDGYRPHKTF